MEEFGAEGYGVWWIILETIAQLMDKTDRCFARYSVKVWANSCKVSAKKFQNLIRFLEKKNKFSLKFEGKFLTIECKKLLEYRDEYSKKAKKEEAKNPDNVQARAGQTPLQDTETDTETDTELKIITLRTDFPCQFEEFWSAYPRKESKKKALDIWRRKKIDSIAGMVINDVLTRKEKHSPWQDIKYVPHATTYLNGERWHDEIVEAQKQEKIYANYQPTNKNDRSLLAVLKTCYEDGGF